ncbi:Rab11 [Hexamita inflata]|uniref:Rab11 n=1 Tax=Hexamita inflata TaxID=28002 RepID=A0AA86V3F8_9EUKA|nr:Rab11 [Hexamita inflata]
MSTNYLIKSIIIGASKTGKSYLLSKFTNGKQKANYQPTVGVEFGSKMLQLELKGIIINTLMQIWDTAGAEIYQTITNTYYKGSSVVFIVFDLNNTESFQKCKFYMENVQQYCLEDVWKNLTILIGTQLSDERKVTTDQALLFAKQNNILYSELNKDTNVDEILHTMAKRYIQLYE